MAYTSALGADAERRGGSSPLPGTVDFFCDFYIIYHQNEVFAMKQKTKKLVESIAAAILDAAHEGAKGAVNEITHQVHVELERQKQERKKKLSRWANK